MSAPAATAGLDQAPTEHGRLLAWVHEVAELTMPDRVVWCDGSEEEWRRLTGELVASGALVPLNAAKKPKRLSRRSGCCQSWSKTRCPGSCCWDRSA